MPHAMQIEMVDQVIGRAQLYPRSGVGVAGPWLVIAPPGNPVIRLDLRLLDRVGVWDDDEIEGTPGAQPRSHLMLACGELDTCLYIADGADAVEAIVREASPLTRDGASGSRPASMDQSPSKPNVAEVSVDESSPDRRPRLMIVSSSADREGGASSTNALAGLAFDLVQPEISIGRTDENDIVIRHPSISRNHARLTRDHNTGRYAIHNVDATNGVRVNGEAHETVELHDGDWIDLGHVRMRFRGPLEVRVAVPDAPADPERLLVVGNDVVRLRDEFIQVGGLAFRVNEVREYALQGANIPLGENRLLQAALAMFVVAAAEREAESVIRIEDCWTARSGSGDGPPIVWLHGGPGLWDYLEPAAALTDALCVSYHYDQRGCGRTRARGGYSVAQSVSDLEALRAHWGAERFILAGHGWGASLALHYSLAHPERVAGRVLIGTCGLVPGSREAASEELRRRLDPERRARMDALTERLDAGETPEDERALLELVWAPDCVDPASARTLFVDDLRINGSVHSSLDDADRQCVEAPGFLDRLRGQSIPTLVVHGELDTRPASAARELAALLPAADLLLVPRAGHYPWLEAPDVLSAGLSEFIRRVGLGASRT
jgi:proline iminopeptidase